MVDINISWLIQMANFIFLIWVLNLILYRPIRNVLIKRREKIEGLQGSLEALDRDRQEKDDAFAEGIRSARIKGKQEKEALIVVATAQEKQIIDEINRKAQADMAEIRVRIGQEAEAVRSVLQNEVEDYANRIGQKILGRAIA